MSNDYINCVPIQSRVILTEQFLESQKSILGEKKAFFANHSIIVHYEIRYFKWLRRGNFFQNETKFPLSIHYFSLNYVFKKNII